jgi:hypothetical protein
MTYRVQECVRCGFCCKLAPCGYGEVDPATGHCRHLTVTDTINGVPTHGCSRYDFIRQQPDAHISPAFGAGCSSTLFNGDRRRVLAALAGHRSGPDGHPGRAHVRVPQP